MMKMLPNVWLVIVIDEVTRFVSGILLSHIFTPSVTTCYISTLFEGDAISADGSRALVDGFIKWCITFRP